MEETQKLRTFSFVPARKASKAIPPVANSSFHLGSQRSRKNGRSISISNPLRIAPPYQRRQSRINKTNFLPTAKISESDEEPFLYRRVRRTKSEPCLPSWNFVGYQPLNRKLICCYIKIPRQISFRQVQELSKVERNDEQNEQLQEAITASDLINISELSPHLPHLERVEEVQAVVSGTLEQLVCTLYLHLNIYADQCSWNRSVCR